MARALEIQAQIKKEVESFPELYKDKTASEIAIIMNREVSYPKKVYIEVIPNKDAIIAANVTEAAKDIIIAELVTDAKVDPIEVETKQIEVLVPYSELLGTGIVTQGEIEAALGKVIVEPKEEIIEEIIK
jgi:hypothetical protein